MKTAILVDGGFYRRRAASVWGEKSPSDRADELVDYCLRHLSAYGPRKDTLYRIFYYDCPPYGENVYHPLLKKDVFLGKTDLFKWMNSFIEELKKKRKLALRLGTLSAPSIRYDLKYTSLKKLLAESDEEKGFDLSSLTEDDFRLNIVQKGVDMRIGVDIASLSFKNQVTRIVLISDDSDFVPAAKLARREGIDFILDPMWNHVNNELFEHIDGLKSCFKKPQKKD